MSSSPRSAARSVGLCLHQPRGRVPLEPFWVQFMHGAENVLASRGLSLILQVVSGFDEEEATYRRWRHSGQIAGVIVVDLIDNDRRVPLLSELGLPAVILGNVEPKGFAVVATDAEPLTDAIMQHVASNGHASVSRVTGPAAFLHTIERDAAFRAAGERLGIRTASVVSDYTAAGGREATEALLADGVAGTAIIYDNDVMALAGLEVLRERGMRVPEDMAVIAWDDSLQCQLASPPLTATARDLVGYGALAAKGLLETLDGHEPVTRQADQSALVVRASSASVPAARAG